MSIIDKLQQQAIYTSGVTSADPNIKLFWFAMKELSFSQIQIFLNKICPCYEDETVASIMKSNGFWSVGDIPYLTFKNDEENKQSNDNISRAIIIQDNHGVIVVSKTKSLDQIYSSILDHIIGL